MRCLVVMLVYTTLDGRGGTLVQPSMDKIRASFEVTSYIDCEFRDESNSTQSVNVECLTKIVDVIIRVTLRPSQFRNGYPKGGMLRRILDSRWRGRTDKRVINETKNIIVWFLSHVLCYLCFLFERYISDYVWLKPVEATCFNRLTC